MDKDWEGSTEYFVKKCNSLIKNLNLDEEQQLLSVRLVRDYVARGILTKPKRVGKEVFYSYTQIIQMLACRFLIKDGWSLKMISNQFKQSSLEEIESLISDNSKENEALNLIKTFNRNLKKTKNDIHFKSINRHAYRRYQENSIHKSLKEKISDSIKPSISGPVLSQNALSNDEDLSFSNSLENLNRKKRKEIINNFEKPKKSFFRKFLTRDKKTSSKQLSEPKISWEISERNIEDFNSEEIEKDIDNFLSIEMTDESNKLNQNNYKELVQKLNAISEKKIVMKKAIRLEVAPGITIVIDENRLENLDTREAQKRASIITEAITSFLLKK